MRNNCIIGGGLLLLAAALCLTLWNLHQGDRAGRAAQEALTKLQLQIPEPEPESESEPEPEEIPDYILDPSVPMPVLQVDGADYIGTLSIPALGLELPILSQWSDAGAKTAPCRYAGSAYLDDLIIAGHNYRRHFAALSSLSPGDEISFSDTQGNLFRYQVSQTQQLPGTAIEEMSAGDWDLTLFTCTAGGQARFTVRCQRVI